MEPRPRRPACTWAAPRPPCRRHWARCTRPRRSRATRPRRRPHTRPPPSPATLRGSSSCRRRRHTPTHRRPCSRQSEETLPLPPPVPIISQGPVRGRATGRPSPWPLRPSRPSVPDDDACSLLLVWRERVFALRPPVLMLWTLFRIALLSTGYTYRGLPGPPCLPQQETLHSGARARQAPFFLFFFCLFHSWKATNSGDEAPEALAPAVSRGQGRGDAVYDAVNAVSNSGNIANAEEFILIVCKIV